MYLLTYLLAYLLHGGYVHRVIACTGLEPMHRVLGRAFTGFQSFWSKGQSPLKLENICQTNMKFEYLQK